ncbi:MAG: D-alanyl-D-alanine carboxypeptidase [Ruminococcaceae bacterium]|nr:D-alanyl-D-alanine carboxypeptidase [Oscillospiraceae bacterium]
MDKKEKQRNQYTFLQRFLTGLLTICAALLLAIGIYGFSVWFTEYAEEERIRQEAEENIRYALEHSGIGRDEAQALIREGVPDEEEDAPPPIVSVDESFVECYGSVLPEIRETTLINSTCAILLERESGQILFEKDANRSTYPASLTKIMTAVLGMELHPDMDSVITITDAMLAGLMEANASQVGFAPGEEVTYLDLLHGLLLPSGADAANAIAVTCAGSVEKFVERMNEKAVELSMDETHFTNVHGLHDVTMRTTAADMAKLFQYALTFDTFREIVAKPFHTTAATNLHPDGITFYSTMFSMLEATELPNGAVIMGGKTGTTTPAGQCLASYCTLGEREFILVTLGAFGYTTEQHFNAEDAVKLYGLIKLE